MLDLKLKILNDRQLIDINGTLNKSELLDLYFLSIFWACGHIFVPFHRLLAR